MANKTDIARQIFLDNPGLSRSEIVSLIMAALETTKGNASTHYSKVAKMTNNPGLELTKPQTAASLESTETDEEIAKRISVRFNMMSRMTQGMVDGVIRSAIIYGPAGVGKTFEVEQKLAAQPDSLYVDIIKGTCTAAGLYHALFHARKNGIIVLDDCDTVFDDEQTLNILKAALDSTQKRVISWRKRSSWIVDVHEDDIDAESDELPRSFEFKGGLILLTNIDFQAKMDSGNKSSAHFKALMSRSLFLDLTMNTEREVMIRIKTIFTQVMAPSLGLSKTETKEIMSFVAQNAGRMIDLSLRLMVLVTDIFRLGGDWKTMVETTKMRNKL